MCFIRQQEILPAVICPVGINREEPYLFFVLFSFLYPAIHAEVKTSIFVS